ncbi:MAG: sulfite exporter TauE/SafE family protein [Anaerolineaceae bacterium]|nr:sulfite exporter TauE/SafE family protein [Anaerolineaceae bacterium]
MDHIFVILFIIFLSTLIQSTFSFGGALVALPLLVFFVDVKSATVLVTLLAATIAIFIVIKNWRDIQFQNAWRLIVSAFVGIPFGILFLGQFDGKIVKIILAITVLILTTLNLITFKKNQVLHVNYAYPFGFISGLLGGAYNISGPPIVLYGSLSNWPPVHFRATLQSYALLTNLFAIFGHFLAGNITAQIGVYYLYALPITAVSLWAGNYFQKIASSEQYAKYVKVLLLILGLYLLVSTLLQH